MNEKEHERQILKYDQYLFLIWEVGTWVYSFCDGS